MPFSTRDLALAIRLTRVKIQKEIFSKSLGFVWWYLDPLINTVILYVVTAVVLRTRTEDAALFLLTGLLIFRYLQTTMTGATNSLAPAFTLSSRLYLPKYVFVLRDVLAETLKFLIGIAVLLLLMLLLGSRQFNPFETLVVTAIAFLFGLGTASVLAVIGALFSDVRVILGYLFRMLFFISGVFFSLERVPEEWRGLFMLNPFALMVNEFRAALLLPDGLQYGYLGLLALVSLLLCAVGFYLLMRYDRILPKYVI